MSLFLPQIDTSTKPRNRIFISATDQAGNALTDFRIGNFSLTEEGVPGVPEELGLVTDSLFVTLVVDRSGSMNDNGKQQAANNAGVALMSALKSGDTASFVEFSDTVRTTVPFTTNISQIIAAIQAGTSDGSTALYDAVKVGVDGFGDGSQRKLLIVLTDGMDDSSQSSIDDCIKEANIKGIGVYTVGIGSDYSADVLGQIASETGASTAGTIDGSDLTAIFLQILSRFNNLVYVKYRQRQSGELTVYMNYGSFVPAASRRIEQASQ